MAARRRASLLRLAANSPTQLLDFLLFTMQHAVLVSADEAQVAAPGSKALQRHLEWWLAAAQRVSYNSSRWMPSASAPPVVAECHRGACLVVPGPALLVCGVLQLGQQSIRARSRRSILVSTSSLTAVGSPWRALRAASCTTWRPHPAFRSGMTMRANSSRSEWWTATSTAAQERDRAEAGPGSISRSCSREHKQNDK